MSESKHTPGPWNVREYGDGDSLVVHSGEDWRVCFMATPGSSPNAMQQIAANAALIAAAPDMLAALDEISRKYSNGASADTLARIARAAIARAEGR